MKVRRLYTKGMCVDLVSEKLREWTTKQGQA